MKLVHKPLTPWISALCVVALVLSSPATPDESGKQPYLAYYQPDKGFKPAQTALTDIFLQLAGSLEYSGSPEPYLRHIQKEHARISAKFTAKTGKPHVSRMPAHMTAEYLDRFIANWNTLSPKLGLDALAKEAGRCMHKAIRGPSDTGTIVIEIFNEHQGVAVDGMKKGSSKGADFERLRSRLEAELGFTPAKEGKETITAQKDQYIAILVGSEKGLSEAERKEYAGLLRHERFTKAEFSTLEHFYKHGHDKLSEKGKAEMSRRIWSGTRDGTPPDTRKEAITAAKAFSGEVSELFVKINAALPADQAAQVTGMVQSFFIDICRLAHSEFEIGMLEWAVQ